MENVLNRPVRTKVAATVAGLAAIAGLGVTAAPSAEAALPRGYVLSAPIKASPSNASATLAQVNAQSIEIRCYTDTGARWFQVQYYSTRGWVEANLVTNQPSVGRC